MLLDSPLDGVTEELRTVTREGYLAAKEPTPDEVGTGAGLIEGLERAVLAYLDLRPDALVQRADADVLERAARRVETRHARGLSPEAVPRAASSGGCR